MKQKVQSILVIIIFLYSSCTSQKKESEMETVGNFLESQISKNNTPGLQYCFFNPDSIIYSYIGGFSDIKNREIVTEMTTFNANSVTKTFTGLAVLQLAEKDSFKLEDQVSLYLPDFPYTSPITIKQLLTHTSGIPNPLPLRWIHTPAEHNSFDRNAFFHEVFKEHNQTKSTPNEKYAYSNLGYFLLGKLIEKVSGLSYEDYIKENILKPIDINKNELDFVINDTNLHAKGYQKRFSFMNLILGFMMDKSKFMDKSEGKWKPFKSYYLNGPSYGGLIGTGNGFVKYLQELLKPNCKLITDEYKKMMFRENLTNSNKATAMSLSWFKGHLSNHEYYAHAGGGGGWYCEIRLYPQLGKGSVIMFNRTGMSDERFLDNIDKYFIDK